MLQNVDPVSLGALVASVTTLGWTIYNDRRAREIARKAKIEIEKEGEIVVLDTEDLKEPENAELFIDDILSRIESDSRDAR